MLPTIWTSNFIIGVVVPDVVEKIGCGTFLFFRLFCFAAGIFSFFFVPEKSKKSLEQITIAFGDNLEEEERELRERIEVEVFGQSAGQIGSEAKV